MHSRRELSCNLLCTKMKSARSLDQIHVTIHAYMHGSGQRSRNHAVWDRASHRPQSPGCTQQRGAARSRVSHTSVSLGKPAAVLLSLAAQSAPVARRILCWRWCQLNRPDFALAVVAGSAKRAPSSARQPSDTLHPPLAHRPDAAAPAVVHERAGVGHHARIAGHAAAGERQRSEEGAPDATRRWSTCTARSIWSGGRTFGSRFGGAGSRLSAATAARC